MPQTQSGTLTKMAPIVFSLFVGGAIGYFFHSSVAASTTPASAGRGGMGSPSMMGGGAERATGGRGGGQPSSGATLSRTVRGLALLQKAQGKGLSAEQAGKMLPLAQEIQDAEKLPEKDAAAKLAAVEAVLTPEQKDALQELQPARGGRGGAGGAAGAMPGMGGGMAGGGGGQPDPDKPFASERNKKGLEDLLASLKAPK